MCCSYWQLQTSSPAQNGSENVYNFDTILTKNFVFTFNYLFDTIKVTTKKMDMVRLWYLQCLICFFGKSFIFICMLQKVLSTVLWEFCKVVSNLSSNINGLNLIVPNLKKLMKCPMFLEVDTGKLTIADIFTCSQQLFLVIF